jgi:hypothetical protein
MLRMTRHCAARVERDAGKEIATQITRLYQLAYGRPPGEDELKQLQPFVEQHGLAALCRVVMNSNEFLYVD